MYFLRLTHHIDYDDSYHGKNSRRSLLNYKYVDSLFGTRYQNIARPPASLMYHLWVANSNCVIIFAILDILKNRLILHLLTPLANAI